MMTLSHNEKIRAIQFIRPNAEFCLTGHDLEWQDTKQSQPTDEEIAQAWIDLQAKETADRADAHIKRTALLDRLGITEEEAKLLLS